MNLLTSESALRSLGAKAPSSQHTLSWPKMLSAQVPARQAEVPIGIIEPVCEFSVSTGHE